MRSTYRTDIEALRGVSVILVILYHFKFGILNNEIIKGGFLGVDIFFVISGYIITKIIIESKIKNFSLLGFYSKRIKRIIPLFSIVLIFSIIILPFIFDNFLINENINSIIAAASGASNFYFWIKSTLYGFAEKNNIINLHFWSLSIEIQFYILFPILFILFKNNKKILVSSLFIFFIISYIFICKIHEVHNFFNFYNSLSRVFEFTFGSLIFFYSNTIKLKIKKNFYSYFYLTGIFFLLFYIYTFNDEGRHPNPYSIILLISLALIIIFNNDNEYPKIKKYLGFLGKISYSLYLWHFLILILGSSYFEEYTDLLKALSVIICFLISFITYLFIEKKFREIHVGHSLSIFFLLILLLIISKQFFKPEYKLKIYNTDNYFLGFESSSYLRNKNKFSLRKSKNIFSFKNDSKNYSPQFDNKNNKLKVFIVGDSHSKDLFNIFITNKDRYQDMEFARYGINLKDLKNYRKDVFVNSHNFINADYILFSQRYVETDLNYIKDLIDLSKKNQKKLILFLKRPEFTGNDKKNKTVIDKFYLENNKEVNKEIMDKFLFQNLNKNKFKEINNQIKLLYGAILPLYDLYSLICNEDKKKCHSVNNSGNKIFYDYGHLTIDGSRFIGGMLYKSNFVGEFLY